jgi:hypothetical protein
MKDLFDFAAPQIKPRPKKNNHCIFIFDWDVEEQTGTIVGIISDIRLRDSMGKPIPCSSLLREELSCAGWESFVDRRWNGKRYGGYALNVSGRYRWEGEYWANQDYWGEWDCGWDLISLEPADRKTRKAVAAYGPGWNEIPKD